MKELAPIPVPPRNRYKTPFAVLKAAYNLLSDRKHWIQQELSRDCHGRYCSPRSGNAVAVCALGAIRLVDGPAQDAAAYILAVAADTLHLKTISPEKIAATVCSPDEDAIFAVNDADLTNSYQEVRRMFRRAMRLAKVKNFLARMEAANSDDDY